LGLEVQVASHPEEAVFLRRLNRFNTLVNLKGKTVQAYLPNSGRLQELLKPGNKVLIEKAERKGGRKTGYTLIGAITQQGVKVSVDARMPNRLIAEALRQGVLPGFESYHLLEVEPIFKGSRLDLLAEAPGRKLLIEVKSCTLAKNRTALFPDAPTLRGRRHLETLVKALREGFEAAIFFVSQRDDVSRFKPNRETDPALAEALKKACLEGVKVHAFKAMFDGLKLKLLSGIPVEV